MRLAWYASRLARMSPDEIAWRVRDEVLHRRWRRAWRRGGDRPAPAPSSRPDAVPAPLPADAAAGVDAGARQRLLEAADGLLAARWPLFARVRDDMAPAPDWFRDPRTGRRAPAEAFCFDIQHRDEARVGNIKYVWEASRHHQTTVLAAAWHLSHDDRYARAAADQLTSWWRQNPYLTGVHWTSGIELGVRLIAWVWTRRLLTGWYGVGPLFDENPVFRRQLHDHQTYLATFKSRGTSANNHLLAELAGQFVAACAFPWFADSARWCADAAAGLRRELPRQTHHDGWNRELATAYHAFVLEIALAAALEGEISGRPLGDRVWHTVRSMTDAAAAVLDVSGRPPRQGDDDEGHGLVVDAPGHDRWGSLLATGAHLLDPAPWWPSTSAGDVRTPLWTALACGRPLVEGPRPANRPALFPDSGMVVLRAADDTPDELWCRLDHGPHGFLAIAAHAHADALSIELRVGGVDVLADPGTYCYHGERRWRSWFRSTRAHNTLEIAGADQSMSAGPFMWGRHATTTLEHVDGLTTGPVAEWRAEHDGYVRLRPGAIHRRSVRLLRPERRLEITDTITSVGVHPCRLSFHLGPDVTCTLEGDVASLTWPTLQGDVGHATLALPPSLTWTMARGRNDPPEGWYSPAFDVKVPATVLIGTGSTDDGPWHTSVRMHDADATSRPSDAVTRLAHSAAPNRRERA